MTVDSSSRRNPSRPHSPNPMNALTAISIAGYHQESGTNPMQSKLTDLQQNSLAAHPATRAPQTFDLFAYCYSDRLALLPQLTSLFTQCGGWVLERRTLSPTAMDFRFELQLSAVLELYGALVAAGLELTRAAHTTLTDLCTCRKHIDLSTDPNQILTLRLEISFLADVTLHSILMTGSSLA
jgi:hypothetical protein